MLSFINRLVQIYLVSGQTIKGLLTDFTEDFLSLTEIGGRETLIFRPMENILMIRMMEENMGADEELDLPSPELPTPKVNYEQPDLIARDFAQQRVSQVKQHHQAVGQFLARSNKFVPQVKYETPNFQKPSFK